MLRWEVPEDLDGRSLAHACRTGEAPALPVYGESEYPRVGFGRAPLRSLTVDRWKYIDAPKPELYDWRADPGELSSVVDEQRDVAERMRSNLVELAASMMQKRHAAVPIPLDSEALERLAALGYVGGSSTADVSDDAVLHFERVLALVPDWELAHRGLGAAYYQLKQYARAEPHCRRCVEHDPTSPRYLANLGAVLLQVGKPTEAIPLLQASLRYDPTGTIAHMTLWRGLAALGRRTEAVRALKAACEAFALTNSHGRGTLTHEIDARLRLYEAGRPYVEDAARSP